MPTVHRLWVQMGKGEQKGMSKADVIFKKMCRDVLDNGCSTEGEKVRPKWDDGSFAYTVKKFGVINR